MVIPIVIFFCIALLVNLSHISSSIYVVQQYQREIDKMFMVDMDVLRCVRGLERSIWQQGYAYIDKVYASGKSLSVYSLPNTYGCIFIVDSMTFGQISEKEYVFKVLLKPQIEVAGGESVDESGESEGIRISELVDTSRYTIHMVVATGDEFYIKRVFIKT